MRPCPGSFKWLIPIKAPSTFVQVKPITPTGRVSPSILLDDGGMQYSYNVTVLDGDGKKGYKSSQNLYQ